ncbi:23S rRNA pseudouridine(2604) synthase RluF [Enterovibrio norvegicus]|uniref:23S rRNA pseudouridine(2604) synthase RluF n=1 Tax=Enterovibrio norvegicus TaxID=188144 RepID=UPI0010BE63AF|nr:23S rRNA pseudouridine(2604) synthase RluF [Enterovibrio norvegicus]MCC4798316.1 23S rRNA pseudouridine(2604) synthase RluF [Enterovibrio norvegicus]TKF33113.1 23S rRNA pseudouridine(2604) synthase RluF [Enterovibrio norvegicus]
MNTNSGIRLNKFISDSGFCSRREADKFIEQRKVTINGIVPELGTKVMPGDEVLVNNQRIDTVPENKSDRVYIAYNKPIGITCTTARNVSGNIVDAIRHPKRIFPIGRLDKPSEGLIFLTSDGDIVNKILRAGNNHEKEYIVTVDKPITPKFVELMSNGIPILDTVTKPCFVERQSKFVFKIILTQGLNRQIRRMCEYLGFEVTKLKRIRIMNVKLGTLKLGEWRELTEKEMDEINNAVAHSKSTFEPDADYENNDIASGDVKTGSSDAAQENLKSGKISFAKPKAKSKLGQRAGHGDKRSFSKDRPARDGARRDGFNKDGNRQGSQRSDRSRSDSDRNENGRPEHRADRDRNRSDRGRNENNRSDRHRAEGGRSDNRRPNNDRSGSDRPNSNQPRSDRPKSDRPNANRSGGRPSQGRPGDKRREGGNKDGNRSDNNARREGPRNSGAPNNRGPKDRRP